MDELFFSDRISDVPRSFIREILKDALSPDTISFAGGLPNRTLFPVKALRHASAKAFEIYGSDMLQYANSEGLLALREWIARRYQKKGIAISPSDILITTGSQQGLDLLGKVFLNQGDGLIIEEPGYLGAIQAFSLYRPEFLPIPVSEAGMDIQALHWTLKANQPKLMYTVPNFQNPSGITYPADNRKAVAEYIRHKKIFLIEDDPYGDLRFEGTPLPSFHQLIPDQTILLGSFSKTVVPGFRIGWIAAPKALLNKVLIAKQAADLHTDQFAQHVMYQFLSDTPIHTHIQDICNAYGSQKTAMINSIQKQFPENITFTNPKGGMFLWVTLPKPLTSLQLFEAAVKQKVIFVPGDPFYTKPGKYNTLRLNFSCSDIPAIEKGVTRLAASIKKLLK